MPVQRKSSIMKAEARGMSTGCVLAAGLLVLERECTVATAGSGGWSGRMGCRLLRCLFRELRS
jgi:hypothetical protein